MELKLINGGSGYDQGASQSSNQQISEQVFNHCGALVTLAEFLKLVENLYACDRHFNKAL